MLFIRTSTILCSLPFGAFAALGKSPLDPHRAPVAKRDACTPKSQGDLQLDDTPAIQDAIQSCGDGGTIVIPEGTTYSLRTMLNLSGCAGCDFQVEGTLKSSTDTSYWETQPAIIYVNGISGAQIRSLTGSGIIDGNGQTAWDQFAQNSSLARPTLVYIVGGSSDITVSGFTAKNPPNVFFSQKEAVENINFASLTMTAKSKSTNLPKNTDGFDIGESTYTTIKDTYVSNQDDCVAFKSGANYVTVQEVTCAGTNHGLSVGSLGKTNADSVQNIYVSNATMKNCSKAAGIKLYAGGSDHGTATVTNVTYDGVTVDGCDYGTQIQSCYGSDDDSECSENPSSATLTDIFFKNFEGETNGKQESVVSNLNCPEAGTCGIHFTDWNVKSPNGTATNLCGNTGGDIGLECTDGASG